MKKKYIEALDIEGATVKTVHYRKIQKYCLSANIKPFGQEEKTDSWISSPLNFVQKLFDLECKKYQQLDELTSRKSEGNHKE